MKDSAEPDVDCPVPIDTLRQLSTAERPADVLEIVRDYPETQRVRLALFCYNRAHLRTLALTLASSIDPVRLAELAGTMGEVLAAQCRDSGLSFGTEPVVTGKPAKSKPKISLGGPR